MIFVIRRRVGGGGSAALEFLNSMLVIDYVLLRMPLIRLDELLNSLKHLAHAIIQVDSHIKCRLLSIKTLQDLLRIHLLLPFHLSQGLQPILQQKTLQYWLVRVGLLPQVIQDCILLGCPLVCHFTSSSSVHRRIIIFTTSRCSSLALKRWFGGCEKGSRSGSRLADLALFGERRLILLNLLLLSAVIG